MSRVFKKIVLIAFIIIFSLNYKCFADDEIEEVTEEDANLEVVETSVDITEEPETYSKHIICMERSTGEVLYEKDAYTKTAMAIYLKALKYQVRLQIQVGQPLE